MVRAWRIEYEGALYNVLSKGNERCNTVVDDKDRNLQIAEKFGLTYSAGSRRVGVFKDLLRQSTTVQNKFNRIKSLIKI
jgi:hypothetical protein